MFVLNGMAVTCYIGVDFYMGNMKRIAEYDITINADDNVPV